ncbi:FxsC protein [Actinoplanes sp. NPDC051494]|uniref:FxsC protein n=1 Tax=Actinoplanes sp. NPDC051494 TaxID=3363907 RepID=UPI0037945158
MPNFFLSSAAGDDDPYVSEFFEDLRDRVSGSSSDHGAGLSFLGTIGNRDAGTPADMLLRLASCDVFVALTSPRYFRNESCGRQWTIFADRYRPGADRSAMIPVAWAVGVTAPDFVGPPLSPPPGPPGTDVERGLRQLIRLRSLRREYEEFTGRLAARIVAAGERVPAPGAEPVTDLGAARNAFALAGSDRRVHFVVAAASAEEMDKVRNDLAYYGADGLDWTPYLPVERETLASRARLLAADRALQADVTTLDDIIGRIERAREAREIVVILCDWWLTQLDAYQRILAEIDRRGLGDTAVLVPASSADRETMDRLPELRFGLRTTFRRSAGRSGALLRSEIGSADAFDADLSGILEEARNRLFKLGARPATGHDDRGRDEPRVDRPILRGP